MSIPRSSEITPDRVRRFAAAIGGYGVVVGFGAGRLVFGEWRSELAFYAVSTGVVLLLLWSWYEWRRGPSRA